MRCIAQGCGAVGAKRCTIIVPASVDHADWSEVHCPEIVREAWKSVGYRLRRTCYDSKHTQQNPRMARWNSLAREHRAPIADIAEVLTFDWLGLHGRGEKRADRTSWAVRSFAPTG